MTPELTVQWGIALIIAALAAITILIAQMMADSRRLHAAEPPCPCCTTSPAQSDDCNCRQDCGVTWCQAHDPGHCPWCDTHACIDRTMCNCTAACGSWLCEAPAEPDPVDAEIEQWLKDGEHRD